MQLKRIQPCAPEFSEGDRKTKTLSVYGVV